MGRRRRVDEPNREPESPRSLFSYEPGAELDQILAAGFPIYQNGVEIDRYYPLQQSPIDIDALDERGKRVLRAFGSIKGLDWDETEANIERIDRESSSSSPLDGDW